MKLFSLMSFYKIQANILLFISVGLFLMVTSKSLSSIINASLFCPFTHFSSNVNRSYMFFSGIQLLQPYSKAMHTVDFQI